MSTKSSLFSLALVLALTLALSGAASAQWFSGSYCSGGSGFSISIGSSWYGPTYAPSYGVPVYAAPVYSYSSCYPVYRPVYVSSCPPVYSYRRYGCW
jgi:hypothetical protein